MLNLLLVNLEEKRVICELNVTEETAIELTKKYDCITVEKDKIK